MKNLLILASLICFCANARAQLPEPGWSKRTADEFMKGKYAAARIDTLDNGRNKATVFSYAPVRFYGVDGTLDLLYFENDKFSGVVEWYCGPGIYPKELPVPDTNIAARLLAKPTRMEIKRLADSISLEKGKPATFDWGNDPLDNGLPPEGKYTFYKWEIPHHHCSLQVNEVGGIEYVDSKY
ncbi:MAG: hypothetical protein Q8919_09150 [Bacteroidota bacterium]|nr:hypothetical protein [Bacteroidota bacterium]